MWIPLGYIDFQGSPVQHTGTHRTNVTCLYSAFLQEKYTFLFSVFFYTQGQEGVETTFCCCTFQDNKMACPQWVRGRVVLGGGGGASSGLGEADPGAQEMSAHFPLKCKQNRIFLLWVCFSKYRKGHYIQTFLETAGQPVPTPTHSASRHFLGFLWLSHLIQQTFIKISAIRQLVVNLYS